MSHPTDLPDLFTHAVDGHLVECVRPADTDRPSWYLYEDGQPLGAVHIHAEGNTTTWFVEVTHGRHQDLDDAVRSLRQLRAKPRTAAHLVDDPHRPHPTTQTTPATAELS
ncbi:hypothetical protein [Streptomyces sp. NPDC001492]